MLRHKYLLRENGYTYTFYSVILSGVHDIKNIKLKLINEGVYSQREGIGRTYNSPWNIAADFDVDMSFNPAEISTMLFEYESNYRTGMDIVVDFGRSQFIIELKIWKGETSKDKAYDQLLEYMSSKRADNGYLLTFDFRKEKNKKRKTEWVQINDKRIFDVIV